MPIYTVASRDELLTKVSELEKGGETVRQVIPRAGENYMIVTETPVNDTGRAWLPSDAKETRA